MRDLAKFVSGLLLLALSVAAAAQYPSRTVRMIVPLSTGSASDAIARLLAQRLSDAWGQQVVVENIPGANTITGATAVTRAAADGHTIAMFASNHLINSSLYAKLPYDTIASFTPIVRVAYVPFVLAVHPSVPARSVKELVALAKARPGQLTYASPGSGAPTHLVMELFKTRAGIDMVHLPYKAVSQAQTDLIGGQVSAMFIVPNVAAPQTKAGRLRALAVSTSKRSVVLPEVPTVAESGFAGFDGSAWVGLFAPAKLPADIVARIAADATRAMGSAEMRERVLNIGLEVDLMDTAAFVPYLYKDRDYWAEMVKISGAKVD